MDGNQLLTIEERTKISIEMGESHFREFKSAYEGSPQDKKPRKVKDVCDDIGRTLVSFANADGGELLVGVEDDGTITGIGYSEEKVDQLKKAYLSHVHKDTPLPRCKIRQVIIDGKQILYFSVPSGAEYCYLTSDGRCLQRKDLESVPVASEEIQFTKNEKNSKQYDRAYVPTASVSDLDIELL